MKTIITSAFISAMVFSQSSLGDTIETIEVIGHPSEGYGTEWAWTAFVLDLTDPKYNGNSWERDIDTIDNAEERCEAHVAETYAICLESLVKKVEEDGQECLKMGLGPEFSGSISFDAVVVGAEITIKTANKGQIAANCLNAMTSWSNVKMASCKADRDALYAEFHKCDFL